jgi:hypothetical protein
MIVDSDNSCTGDEPGKLVGHCAAAEGVEHLFSLFWSALQFGSMDDSELRVKDAHIGIVPQRNSE